MSDYDDKEPRYGARESAGDGWPEVLRRRFAPWFDDVIWNLRRHDGWSGIVTELTEEIARINGGPEAAPDLRVEKVAEEFGGLRYYIRYLPKEHIRAIYDAKQRASDRSYEICHVCGQPGRLLRDSGYWRTVCPQHESIGPWQSKSDEGRSRQ